MRVKLPLSILLAINPCRGSSELSKSFRSNRSLVPATNPSSEARATVVTSEELRQRCNEDLSEAFRVVAQSSINEQQHGQR